MFLIGSTAFEFHGISLPRKEDYISDIDLIMNVTEFNMLLDHKLLNSWQTLNYNKILAFDNEKNKYEIELTPSTKSRKYLNDLVGIGGLICNGELEYLNIPVKVPCSTLLYLMKKSHIHQPINWFKNIEDYHSLRPLYEKTIDMEDIIFEAFYNQCKLEVDERINSKINLNVSNNDFFKQYSIDREYDHDHIHEVVKHYDQPMYKKLKKDQDKAICNKELWNNCSLDQKLNAVREEAYVISLERIILPQLKQLREKKDFITRINYTKAYRWAIMRISTTLTKGWFRDFALDHWPMLKDLKVDYLDFLKELRK